MKLLIHFKNFLNETVNIEATRLDTLNSRVDGISSFLATAPVIGELYIDAIPQGSMAHGTIIKPLPNHEFDADFLLEMTPPSDWQPKDYIQEVYTAFRTSNAYKDRVSRKNRCVRVQYANDMHVDVVPYVEFNGLNYITNRNDGENGKFERTNPTGYSEWLDDKNRIASGNLIKVLRLLKWLRDYKVTFTCRSVILNALVGERVSEINLLNDTSYYADVPTTLVHVLEDLVKYLEPYSAYMPNITDPACPEVDFNHRWDNDQYLNFREKMTYYAAKARAAYDEPDRDTSLALWQELFGSDFGKAPAVKASALLPAVSASRQEMFIDKTKGYLIVKTAYAVKIVGRTLPKRYHSTYPLPIRGNRVEKHRDIEFSIERCTVPKPYQVYWKIKNRGEEAIKADCLRGEIITDDLANGTRHREPTAYRGRHYVECYIIKGGTCVAIDRQPVIII